jgi:uncharacterized membrane protein YczE
MDFKNIIIVGVGVILFLYSFNTRESYPITAFFWCVGIVLVYLGLKLEQEKKKGINK